MVSLHHKDHIGPQYLLRRYPYLRISIGAGRISFDIWVVCENMFCSGAAPLIFTTDEEQLFHFYVVANHMTDGKNNGRFAENRQKTIYCHFLYIFMPISAFK